ncbi:795_t:CDS:1, partial [Acaulospora colombiana]
SLQFQGDQQMLKAFEQMLEAFELPNLQNLKFSPFSALSNELALRSLPVQLTSLTLSDFLTKPDQIPQDKPHSMFNLVMLHLIRTGIDGPLQHYFELPK